jgi:hypothetical protein
MAPDSTPKLKAHCPHIARVLRLESADGAPAGEEEMAEAARTVDMAHLVQEASLSQNLDNRLSNLLGMAAVQADGAQASRILFDAFERHVQARGFPANIDGAPLFGGHFVENCFLQLQMSLFSDFDHFDSIVARAARMTGRSSDAAHTQGGLEPAEYWSLVVAACEPVINDNGETVETGDASPAFWSATVRRALDTGMAPTSLVYRMGDWPQCDPKARKESFRSAVKARDGASCLAIFDAIVTERAMTQRIALRAGEVGQAPRRRVKGI